MTSPPRQHPGTSRARSRRWLLGRLAGLGAASLAGAVATACGGPFAVPDPRALVGDALGQAQQATGAAPVPKLLHWITPIPPPNETLAANPIGSSRVRAQGWAATLDPWKAAHPEIRLVHHIAAFDDLTPQQLAAAKSGSPADVAYTDAGRTLGEAAIVDPLDLGPLGRKIVPVALVGQTAQDQVYALPVFLSCLGLYVGHERFRAAELDPAVPLRDWSSLETAAQKLTNRARQRYGLDVFGSGSPLSGQVRYAPFLWSAGGSFFDDAAAKATWNERPGLDSIRYLARLAQNYASPGAAVAEDAALLQNWLSGQTAMLLAGPELTAEIDPSALPYGVQSVPAYIQGQASSLASSAGAVAVFAHSKHKDWALDFVRYLAGRDAQVAGLAHLPLLPANVDAGDEADVFKSSKPLGAFLRILREDDVHAFPLARAHNPEIQRIFQAYLGVALQGLATPEAAWNKSVAAANKLFSSGN